MEKKVLEGGEDEDDGSSDDEGSSEQDRLRDLLSQVILSNRELKEGLNRMKMREEEMKSKVDRREEEAIISEGVMEKLRGEMEQLVKSVEEKELEVRRMRDEMKDREDEI